MKFIHIPLATFLTGFLVAWVLGSCETTPPKTDVIADNNPKPAPAAEKSGTQLWSENCVRCHNSRSPAAYSDSQWAAAMMHMRVRANLTAEEHRKILEFLQSAN